MHRRKSKMNSFTKEEDKIILENEGGTAAVAQRLNRSYTGITIKLACRKGLLK